MIKTTFMFVFTFLLFFILTPSIVIFNIFPKKFSKYVIALIHSILFAIVLATGIHLANTQILSKETLMSAGTIDICTGADGSIQSCNKLPTGVKSAMSLSNGSTIMRGPAPAPAPVSVPAPAVAPAVAPAPAPAPAPVYVGCYKDSTTGSNRALPNLSPTNVTSVAECQKIAMTNGASVFGLQNGNQCFYGTSLSSAQQYGSTSGSVCATLGGFNTNQLYLTKPYAYKGCYKDSSTRAIPNQTSNVTSVTDCQKQATTKGAQLFGLQDGAQCFLGNNLTQATGYGPASGCAPLGNAWTNQVYSL